MSINRRLRHLSKHHLIAIDRLSDNLTWNTHSLDHALCWLHLRLHQLLTIRGCLLLCLQLLLRLLLNLIHHVLLLRNTLRLGNLHRNILRSNVYFTLVWSLLLLLNWNILNLLRLLLNCCSRWLHRCRSRCRSAWTLFLLVLLLFLSISPHSISNLSLLFFLINREAFLDIVFQLSALFGWKLI